ncbi:unnamed protein product [Allacma fusca]|uniref:Receptor protein-tyrosine kinase n=1 Tax=Allacma fusca TaxID=39272 RepID=A0A8J2K1E2_9HEXA|nr:unnamed protein product [Allacma fusca]
MDRIDLTETLFPGNVCTNERLNGMGQTLIWSTFVCHGTSTIQLQYEVTFDVDFSIKCGSKFSWGLTVEQDIPIERFETEISKFGETISLSATGSEKIEKSCNYRSFSGNYTFFSYLDPNWNITFDLRFLSRRENKEKMNISDHEDSHLNFFVSGNLVVCKLGYFDGEMIIGTGRNPTETRLLKHCLTTKDKPCANTNWFKIYRGKNCLDIPAEENCTHELDLSHGLVYCSAASRSISREFFTSINGYTVLDNMDAIWNDTNVIQLREDDHKANITVNADVVTAKITEAVIFETEIFPFECQFLNYLLIPPIFLAVELINGTNITIPNEQSREKITVETKRSSVYGVPSLFKEVNVSSLHFKFEGVMGVKSVKCAANYWNFRRMAVAQYPVKVRSLSESTLPSFNTPDSTHVVDLGATLSLTCSADSGYPEPTYSWNVSATKYYEIHESVENNRTVSILTIDSINVDMNGVYICIAQNVRAQAQRRFQIAVREGISLWITVGTPVGVIMLLGITLAVLSRKFYLQRGRLSSMEIKLFEKGDELGLTNTFAHENAQFMPYNKAFEIKWDEFQIYEDKKLGEGAYGIVFQGALVNNSTKMVAIKTVKPGVEKSILLALLSELKVMIHLDIHEHIVALIGACTEFLRDGRVYILVEYCPMGNLQDHLRKQDKNAMYMDITDFKSPALSPVSLEDENFYGDTDILNYKLLVKWSIQIARGMQHLESKKVIHGDLATRNILLYNKSHVKITDFGLSRQLLDCDNYVKKSENKLPWRWLALESLKSNVFTHKSDVWSYGVTLWEIFTLGLIPYPGMRWTTDFMSFLEQNLRLSKPLYASDEMYKLLMRCWDVEPNNRPGFKELEQLLLVQRPELLSEEKSTCSKRRSAVGCEYSTSTVYV